MPCREWFIGMAFFASLFVNRPVGGRYPQAVQISCCCVFQKFIQKLVIASEPLVKIISFPEKMEALQAISCKIMVQHWSIKPFKHAGLIAVVTVNSIRAKQPEPKIMLNYRHC